MKKSKVLIGVVALSTALMGTGYAWWTDAVTVQGTVATGKMNVQLINAGVKTVGGEVYGTYVEPDVVKAEDKEITFKADNLYPDAQFKINFTAKNDGTIPVKLDNLTVKNDKNVALIDNLEYSLDGKNFKDLAGLETALKEATANEIAVNDVKDYTIFIKMPSTIKDANGESDAFEDLKDNTFTITYDWAQFNYEKPQTK